MNISRMHIEFKLGVDKNTNSTPNILPEEIDVYLQDAYEEWLEQRLFGNNPKQESFEETQKRMDDLSGLIRNSSLTIAGSSSDSLENGNFVILPEDYRHAIFEEAQIECSSGTNKYINVVEITHNRFNQIKDNPFAQPTQHCFYRLAFSPDGTNQKRFEVIGDGVNNLTGYRLRYIKDPLKIDLGQTRTPLGLTGADTIEVNAHAQREIINEAVQNALEAIGSPRSQSHKINIIEQE